MDTFLLDHPLFEKIPRESLSPLISKEILRDEFIFSEGDKPDAVYMLKTGLVKTVKYASAGTVSTIDYIFPGQFFGMIAVLDNKNYPVSAVAMKNSECIRIPAELFQGFIHQSGEFRNTVFKEVGAHVRNSQTLRSIMQMPVEKRIAHILNYLSDIMGMEIHLLREDIAAMAGCTHSTAVRTLIEFRKKKIIQTAWKKIKILSPDKLKALIS